MSFMEFIRFRNSENVGVVTIQCFMILSACLVVTGLLYVTLVIVLIIFHHLIYDRVPSKVPPFVKRAIQFDSGDEDEDEDGSGPSEAQREAQAQQSSSKDNLGRRRTKKDNIIEIGDEYDVKPIFSTQNTNARKIHALEKFMNSGGKDPDVGVGKKT